MVPEASLNCGDAELRGKIAAVLRDARTPHGKECFWVEEAGESLSLMAHTPKRDEIVRGIFLLGTLNDPTPREQRYGESGVSMLEVEKGSGHHMPEGILALAGRSAKPADRRTPMPATKAKGLLLERVGLEHAA
mgnify:CR=1 FL=1